MAKLTTNATVRTNPIPAANTRTSAVEIHQYSAKVQNDYDYVTLIVGGVSTVDASINAVDEYFRMTNLLPNTVTLTQIK